MKIYIESSIIGYAANEKAGEKHRMARELLRLVDLGVFEAYISAVTLAEIENAPEWIRHKLRDTIAGCELAVLPLSEEAEDLAGRYVAAGVISGDKLDDARHLSIATLAHVDSVVSYNFKHLVRHEVRTGVTRVNRENGYREIDVCSPEEIL